METPLSSARRVSSEKNNGKPERSALLDITNDSPIIGIAMGGLVEKKTETPSSAVNKSGEALLRGQVKTLLNKVEEEKEEAKLVNKIHSDNSPSFRALLGLFRSPSQLLAPTPANTPSISEEDVTMIHPEVAEVLKQEEALDLHECVINRALLFNSPEKSEISDSSNLSSSLEKSSDDDNSSAWSIQVNTSIKEHDEEEEEEEEESFDDLCEDLRKMSMHDNERLPEFMGKHTRFVYNSDDEIEGEEEGGSGDRVVSPSVLLLKGLPAPEGKHLRFHEEDED